MWVIFWYVLSSGRFQVSSGCFWFSGSGWYFFWVIIENHLWVNPTHIKVEQRYRYSWNNFPYICAISPAGPMGQQKGFPYKTSPWLPINFCPPSVLWQIDNVCWRFERVKINALYVDAFVCYLIGCKVLFFWLAHACSEFFFLCEWTFVHCSKVMYNHVHGRPHVCAVSLSLSWPHYIQHTNTQFVNSIHTAPIFFSICMCACVCLFLYHAQTNMETGHLVISEGRAVQWCDKCLLIAKTLESPQSL